MPLAGAASSAARVVWDVCEQGQALLAVLFPHLAGLRVHRVEDAGDAVMIVASCQAEAACCPRCGQESARVHGGYARMVADGAAGGRPVHLLQQVVAVPAVPDHQVLPGGLAPGQVQVIDPGAVHLLPGLIHHPGQPARCRDRQRLQRRPQRLPGQLQPVQRPDRAQHVGGSVRCRRRP